MNTDDQPDRTGSIRHVATRRISTADAGEGPVRETVPVVLEGPMTIDVHGMETYTLLCTPDDNLSLAAGFLVTEGIVGSLADVVLLKECEDDPSIVRVILRDPGSRVDEAGRSLLIVSSCGLCGVEKLDEKLRTLPRVGDSLRLDSRVLRFVASHLREQQPLFRACGGTHAAIIYNAGGEIVASAEDTARHSALDKAIGRCLLDKRPLAGCGAMLSGRVSLEMVSKCARVEIELISAISAPTSLAIEVADRCGITLCAFVRDTRATVFTHPERITDHPGKA